MGQNSRCDPNGGTLICKNGTQWNNYDQIRTQYKQPLTDFGGDDATRNLKFNYRTEALTFAGAYNWNESQSFGIGVNVYFSWLQIQGFEFFDDIGLVSDPGYFSDNGNSGATGVGVTLGYLGRFFCDQLAVGFAWSPKVHMGEFSKYRGLLADHRIDIPETYRVGLAYDWDCATTIAADYEFRRYSRVHSLANSFPGSGPVFGPEFGTSDGPGFGWSDQSTVKVGVNYAWSDCLVARLGYRWEQSPIRNQTTATALNVLTQQVIQNYLTFGATYNWDYCSEISLFGEWGIRGHKRSALPVIAAGGDVIGGRLHFESQSFATGISWGQQF